MAKKHKDLEFHVDAGYGASVEIFDNFDKATDRALVLSIQHGGSSVNVDVITWSKGAARAYDGDCGVEQYLADPDASVHERIVIKATSEGRIA
jgi:hypothetical protein